MSLDQICVEAERGVDYELTKTITKPSHKIHMRNDVTL